MVMQPNPPAPDEPTSAPATPRRDEANWAAPVSGLAVTGVPDAAARFTVAGRMLAGPIQGFGKMWRKQYRVPLRGAGVTPVEVIAAWKEHFGEFWPAGNRFYGPVTGLAPGEVAVLDLDMPGPVELSTGVMVLYADEESFTFMTPQGHTMAGWITFSAFEEEGFPVAQAEVLMRASDPLYEIGMILFALRKEDRFWQHTLRALAAYFGVPAEVEMRAECVDPRRQWRYARNIWQNAAIRSGLYVAATPLRLVARRVRQRGAAPSPR